MPFTKVSLEGAGKRPPSPPPAPALLWWCLALGRRPAPGGRKARRARGARGAQGALGQAAQGAHGCRAQGCVGLRAYEGLEEAFYGGFIRAPGFIQAEV